MALRALLFDVDGTLADTEPHGHLPAYNRAFRDLKLGWKWSRPMYRKLLLLPGGRERIAHYLEEHAPELSTHQSAIEQDRGAWVDAVHQLKGEHFRRRLAAGRVPLRPGVRRLMLEAAEAGLQMALVTNASKASVEALLEHALDAQLRGHIDAVIGSEDGVRKKPAPDLYQLACERLQCAPSECIALEDSQMGARAARAAGVPVVATTNADTRNHDFGDALLVTDQLGEPDKPCRVRSRGAVPVHHVDLALLRRLHAAHDSVCEQAS